MPLPSMLTKSRDCSRRNLAYASSPMKMDHNARNTVVLFRGTSVRVKVKECLECFLVAPRRRLGDVIIINALLSRLLINFNALLRFGRQISFGKIKLDPAAIHPAAHAGFQFRLAPIFALLLLKLKRIASLDLRYNWCVSSFLLA